MNVKHYKEILAILAENHPYITDNMEDWRPRGDRGVRVTMRNGDEYDFDTATMCVSRARYEFKVTGDMINDETCRESFSNHLQIWMARRGFNQQELADYTGLSKGAINSYLNKTKTPSITNLRKIAYALDCSIVDLLD